MVTLCRSRVHWDRASWDDFTDLVPTLCALVIGTVSVGSILLSQLVVRSAGLHEEASIGIVRVAVSRNSVEICTSSSSHSSSSGGRLGRNIATVVARLGPFVGSGIFSSRCTFLRPLRARSMSSVDRCTGHVVCAEHTLRCGTVSSVGIVEVGMSVLVVRIAFWVGARMADVPGSVGGGVCQGHIAKPWNTSRRTVRVNPTSAILLVAS